MSGKQTGKEEMMRLTCERCHNDFFQAFGYVTLRVCPKCLKELSAEFWAIMAELEGK